ncbi:MAG TPA: OmpA family protein [Polyangiaceae bacterium]|nr:OmpA family protein [Polyangiaceae bacterium]
MPLRNCNVVIPVYVVFETGLAALSRTAYCDLENMLGMFGVTAREGRKILVLGHSDPTEERDGSKKLAAARAQAVADFLVARGIPAASVVASTEHREPSLPLPAARSVTFEAAPNTIPRFPPRSAPPACSDYANGRTPPLNSNVINHE